MSVTSSNQFFINMKSVPTKDSSEYDAFFEEEKRKMDYGITIDGVYIHGWLYTHLNHWHIYLDKPDPYNPKLTKLSFVNPNCRDNEWIISENLSKAENEKRGLMIFGSRRLGKSEFLASYIGRSAILYQGSENLITGGNWADIDIITGKLDKGLSAMHPYFKWARFGDNWRKDISLGFKKKRGSERVEWSTIRMRNYENGINTEAAAGTTPSTFVIDEIGKFKWVECFRAAVPSFTTPYGWRLVPIATGTSGLILPHTDAEIVFNNPESEGFLAVELKEEKKRTAVFIQGTRRMEAKYETNFGTFIENENGVLIAKESELFKITFWNSDIEKGNAIIEKEIADANMSPDPTAAMKVRMYYPRNTGDLFLTEEENRFPIEAIKEWLAYLESQKDRPEIVGTPIRLYRDIDGKVKYTTDVSTKEILDWPVTNNTIKDAPIIIYQFPIPGEIPYLLYVAGADPYNQDASRQSESLGTLHIYKRMYDPVNGTFQKSIVASLASRPKIMKQWHETVEMLLEFYNATCMPENEGGTFVQYFDSKNKSHLLADGYSLNKEISPNSTIQRPKGLPASLPVINYCMNLLYEYCLEDVIVGVNEQTKEPIRKLGIVRIRDKMLLTEMLNHRKGENYDRIVSFRHALAYDRYLDKYHPVIKVSEHEEEQKPKRLPPRSPFTLTGTNPFIVRSRR
jgi:hypothetical protein